MGPPLGSSFFTPKRLGTSPILGILLTPVISFLLTGCVYDSCHSDFSLVGLNPLVTGLNLEFSMVIGNIRFPFNESLSAQPPVKTGALHVFLLPSDPKRRANFNPSSSLPSWGKLDVGPCHTKTGFMHSVPASLMLMWS